MKASWLGRLGKGVRLTIRVQPRASRTEIVGPYGDALKIRLKSPPVDGAANRELIAFLSKRLHRPRSSITIRRGERDQLKTLSVNDISPVEVFEALSTGLD